MWAHGAPRPAVAPCDCSGWFEYGCPVPPREDLETALAERWDDDNLAVYGDELEAQGDPRGALIAIDRAIDRALGGHDAATAEQLLGDHAAAAFSIDQRREHLVAWLGGRLASELPRHGSARFGFLEVRVRDDLESERFYRALLASPARTYLRRLLVLDHDDPASVLEPLAAAPNPWLQELVIRQAPGPSPPAISTALGGRVIAATPRLHSMHVRGRRIFDELPHPHLRALSIQGFDALGSLSGAGPALPALQRLDFAFFDDAGVGHQERVPGARLVALLPAARLPALRELDLSRNEPTAPGVRPPGAFHYGGTINPFRFLLELSPAERLTRLAVPAVRTAEQARLLSASLESMSALERLEIPHGYRGLAPPPELHHPRADIRVAPPWPWRPMEQLLGHDRIQVAYSLPIGPAPSLVTLAIRLEGAWDRLGMEARRRWAAFWDALDPMFQGTHAVTVDARLIVDAFATLPGRSHVLGWAGLYNELRAELEAGAGPRRPLQVMVSRAP